MSHPDQPVSALVRASVDHCVKCTICETACPVAAVTPLFPGPKTAGPQSERFRVPGMTPDSSIDYCSSCGICTLVCPHEVKIAEMNSQARAVMKTQHGIPLRDHLIARTGLAGRVGTPLAPLANTLLANPTVRAGLERVIGIHRRAPLPSFAGRTFRAWARRHASPRTDKRVAYFHGCSTNYYEPGLGERTVAVLEYNGYTVDVPPGQGCCGLPLQSNGIYDAGRGYVRKLAARLAPAARAGVPIVATSTSCGLMLKREAHEIMGVQDDNLALVRNHLFDICEFLLDAHRRGELRTDMQPVPMTVTYHAPCQQRGHGIGKPALDLLALVPGLTVIELDRDCCGIAGTYGLKREKYDVAMAVGAPLFDDIRSAAPDLAVCDSETCRWQISAATGATSVHPIDVLYRAYGLGVQ